MPFENTTFTFNSTQINMDNNVELAHLGFEVTVKNITLAVILITIILVSVLGNMLVIFSFLVEKHLRKPFNLLILNLAISDALVAILAMPFYAISIFFEYWPLGAFVCGLWIFFDWITTFASIFTVVAISVDRFWSVTWAMHYKIYNNGNKAAIMLSVIWIAVLMICCPPLISDRLNHRNEVVCIWEPSDNKEFVIFVSVIGHYVPTLIMVFCFCKVYLVMRHRASAVASLIRKPLSTISTISDGVLQTAMNTSSCSQQHEVSLADRNQDNDKDLDGIRSASQSHVPCDKEGKKKILRESFHISKQNRKKLSFIMLKYVLFIYLVCWFPFYVVFDVFTTKPEAVPTNLYIVVYWIGYANSTLNPFIYAFTNTDFRYAFVKVLQTLWKCKI